MFFSLLKFFSSRVHLVAGTLFFYLLFTWHVLQRDWKYGKDDWPLFLFLVSTLGFSALSAMGDGTCHDLHRTIAKEQKGKRLPRANMCVSGHQVWIHRNLFLWLSVFQVYFTMIWYQRFVHGSWNTSSSSLRSFNSFKGCWRLVIRQLSNEDGQAFIGDGIVP